MKDEIQGWVTKVIDGTTFDMEITHVGAHNRFHYFHEERVRLPALSNPRAAAAAKARLRMLFEGMAVICQIDERDSSGRLLAEGAIASFLPQIS